MSINMNSRKGCEVLSALGENFVNLQTDGSLEMRLEQYEFTGTLKGQIIEAERKLGELCERLNFKYREAAAARDLDVKFRMSREGYDTFSPYYCSVVTLSVVRKETIVDARRIVIWECQRLFFGMPTKRNIPGSKTVGDFMDQSYEKAALELEEYITTFLQQ